MTEDFTEMEDIIKALLDVVRAQHSATEGTEEEPFDMNDIVDMAMNILGRPDESEEVAEMVDSIQKLVETLAPDIFPPKTFEEMDDAERAASAASMIEESLRRGRMGGRNRASAQSAGMEQENAARADAEAGQSETGGENRNPENGPEEEHRDTESRPAQETSAGAAEEYPSAADSGAQEEVNSPLEQSFDAQQTAELNDLIYKNLMEMMGMQNPQVEYPFDPSQIQYGREKSVTEMLEEEREEEQRLKEEQKAMDEQIRSMAQADREESRPRSAWELAQDAIDRDEQAHEKEPYIPQVLDDAPATKSASQLAAEAIRRSQEEDREKLEIEKQAERLMEEAKKRGQDPMKFALHQQEILRYMEKNSDELVSFEDYEDLSPEEKYEIERQIYIEKQLADGVNPDEVDDQVPEEFIPEELKAVAASAATEKEESSAAPSENASPDERESAPAASSAAPVLTEEMLRQLSQEVIRENSDMILSENENEDMESLNDLIMNNIRAMMSGSGAAVPQEDVGDLLQQAAASARGEHAVSDEEHAASSASHAEGHDAETEEPRGLSAVELARAAQKAAKPEPKEIKEGVSAVELAKEAQEKAREAKARAEAAESADTQTGQQERRESIKDSVPEEEPAVSEPVSAQETLSQSEEAEQSDEKGSHPADEKQSEADEDKSVTDEEKSEAGEEVPEESEAENPLAETKEDGPEESGMEEPVAEESAETGEKADAGAAQKEPEEEFEYVDPDELVLGEHTQAEIDEAIANLNSLGLEGEVYERAKRMLLLELAGSEAELDAWLKEQETGKKKKASVSALDGDDDNLDLDDFDEDLLEKELELAMDEDFLGDIDEAPEEEAGVLDPDKEDAESDAVSVDEENAASEEADQAEENVASGADQTEENTVSGAGQTEENTVSGADQAESRAFGADQIDQAAQSAPEDMDEDVISEVEVEDTVPVPGADRKKASVKKSGTSSRKKVVKRREKKNGGTKTQTDQKPDTWMQEDRPVEEKEYQVSLRHPFVLKNSASFMDQFERYIADTQENRKLSTGFKKLDAMLRYGLHKGTYFIDSDPQYLKNSFMQQMADRAAESGVDVLYISTELSRYDLMVDTISRLSYEIHQGDLDKAVSVMSIMTGENGADLESLKDELNWYRGRISEHLYILDQEVVSEYTESMEEASAGDVLAELIRSIVRDGVHKPVVFIDNIENILSVEDSEDIKPLMEGIRRLADELGIPIIMSYGYAQAESETEMSSEESEFHALLGNMCDVYMELQYADMITEDSVEITEEDIQEMVEEGDTLLINVLLHRNRRPLRASCQIQGTPKFNYFEE